MGHLRMTEEQIFEVGYSSPRIEPIILTDLETGLAYQFLFQYSADQRRHQARPRTRTSR